MGRESASGGGDDERPVHEWINGLPNPDDLTPLSQPLITPELASAFSISPERNMTILDVHDASQETMASLSGQSRFSSSSSYSALKTFPPFAAARDGGEVEGEAVVVFDDEDDGKDDGAAQESSRIGEREGSAVFMDEGETGLPPEDCNDGPAGPAVKRQRLVWCPELHKRFVEVVTHLGVKNAVPKAIMQMMNVEGLTRENVASHLQKYRLYLKRMRGLSNEGPSSSVQLFASTPLPQSLHEAPVPVQVPYAAPQPMAFIPMPMYGLTQNGHGAHPGMMPVNGKSGPGTYHGFSAQQPQVVFGQRPGGWPGGNKFGSILSHPRVNPTANKQ